jgi:hypothetical protein
LRHVPKFVALLAVAAVSMTGTAGLANAAPITPASTLASPASGTFQTVTPTRVLNTRVGTGAPQAPLGAGGSIDLKVLGTAGIPPTGVSAVVLNLTVTGGTAPSFLTVWPTGTTRPANVSSINFVAGTNRANLVTAAVGTVGADAGKISIYNNAGSVEVNADVLGYYLADDATTVGGFYQPDFAPSRLVDTRLPKGSAPLAAGKSVKVPVDYNFDPAVEVNSHIKALAVNITAVNPTKVGFLTAYAGGSVLPGTSTLNFAAGSVTPNMAIVPVGKCVACGADTGLPSIIVSNQSLGTTHVLVDIVGYYDDGKIVDTTPDFGGPVEGLRFKPLTPTRIVDTRPGTGNLGATTLKGGAVDKTVILSPRAGVTGLDTYFLVTNTTAVKPTLPTFVTLWADYGFGDPRPGVSNLNPAPGQTEANATITELAMDLNSVDPNALPDRFNIYNNAGNVNVLVDVVGTMNFVFPDLPFPALSATASPLSPASPAGPRTWKRKSTAQSVR